MTFELRPICVPFCAAPCVGFAAHRASIKEAPFLPGPFTHSAVDGSLCMALMHWPHWRGQKEKISEPTRRTRSNCPSRERAEEDCVAGEPQAGFLAIPMVMNKLENHIVGYSSMIDEEDCINICT